MRKKLSILLLTSMFLLGGCGSEQQNYQTPTLTESQYNNENGKQNNKTEASSEDNGSLEVNSENNTFVEISGNQLANLPDKDNLTKLAGSALKSIGVNEVKENKLGNYSNTSSIITVDLLVKTESKSVLMSFLYISIISTPEWKINSIVDTDTKHYYYVTDELKDTVDLYDYKTDVIISKKSKNYKDIQKELGNRQKTIEDNFNNSISSIADKYNINSKIKTKDFNEDTNLNENMWGLSYSVPLTWQMKQGDEGVFYYYPKEGSIMVMKDVLFDITNDYGIINYKNNILNNGTNPKEIQTSKKIINNLNCIEFIYEDDIENERYRISTYTFEGENNIVIFALVSPINSSYDYSEDFNKMLDSIKKSK